VVDSLAELVERIDECWAPPASMAPNADMP